jgi:hypothetical protein
MLLFPFFVLVCPGGNTDFLLHELFLLVGSSDGEARFDSDASGSVLAREENHVVGEVELDFGQRKVGEWNRFCIDDLAVAVIAR